MRQTITTTILTLTLAVALLATTACNPTVRNGTATDVAKCLALATVTLAVGYFTEEAPQQLTSVTTTVCLDAALEVAGSVWDSFTVNNDVNVNIYHGKDISQDVPFQGLSVKNCGDGLTQPLSAVKAVVQISAPIVVTVGSESFTATPPASANDTNSTVATHVIADGNVNVGQDLTAEWASVAPIPGGQQLQVSLTGQLTLRAGKASITQGNATIESNIAYSYPTVLAVKSGSVASKLDAC